MDGTPGEIHAVNGLHCGIPVKAGNHVIKMVYAPSKLVFYVTLISWMLAVPCLILLLFRRNTTWSP